ncbi:Tripartite tricarboxylate transporter TctB family protein [Desulfuromusa kysingii]|uniref:Tripartite tricarboxylate transporter TctB family protein n=1 Tax=Desulfuromusa kysingii TaxID=37625 RepID=A0A1H4DXI8_9BACT|nr:tripartite tricarboxylate transporter TctB family protein [Desulfuromusa kysingii]SEA77209.1 Tripartite tricarboxylate transporter TctB family protein [Desulfuromusa kysingii]
MKNRSLYSELSLVSFFLILTCWYLFDSYKASASTENLLLILPSASVVILLCLWVVLRTCFNFRKQKEVVSEEEQPKPEKKVSVLAAMALLAGYVLSMDWIGFDVATFLFMAALMFLQGERRLVWLGGFSFGFAFLVSLFFEYMIPYPMPMLLGREMIERLI